MGMRVSEARARECTEAGLWRNESLETYLDRWATARPDKTAVVDGQGRYTWGALARAVERVACGLRAHGLEAGGANTRALAERLHVSPATIRNHAQNIFAKLGVHSRLEAVAFATQHHIV